MKTIEELEKIYDLELDKVIFEINNLIPSRAYPKGTRREVTRKKKIKLVLLQFPDGLKPYATGVVDYLEERVDAKFLIWLGDCFGSCDTPVLGKELCTASPRDDLRKQRSRHIPKCGMKGQIDLVVQFGHNDLMPDY